MRPADQNQEDTTTSVTPATGGPYTEVPTTTKSNSALPYIVAAAVLILIIVAVFYK